MNTRVAGVREWNSRALADDARGNAARCRLFAEFAEDFCELLFGRGIHEVRRGERQLRRHAHVEGAVALKREAALGRVELVGTHAEVEQHAVDLADSDFSEHAIDVGKVRVANEKPALVFA